MSLHLAAAAGKKDLCMTTHLRLPQCRVNVRGYMQQGNKQANKVTEVPKVRCLARVHETSPPAPVIMPRALCLRAIVWITESLPESAKHELRLSHQAAWT